MSFTQFQFHPHIAMAIEACGYTTPTPIQQQAFDPILQRRDVLGLAQTGTGKTAAFMLPTVSNLLQGKAKHVRVLVLAPTRELAEQIEEFTRTITVGTRLDSMAIYGGVSKNGQVMRLRRGVDIVVACPGRLLDLLGDRAIDLSRVETLILDEADHMFDKGFLPDIRRILKTLPQQRQSLVFSATMPKELRHLAEDILDDPVAIQIDRIQPTSSVAHALYTVEQGGKTALLTHLLQQDSTRATIVFTKTKHKAKNLASQLEKSGFKATSLQGNLSQNRRQQALDGFKNGTFTVLVATDIAARGIDVTGISHVINYDVPDTPEAYIHRTGRTGRAACTGEAYTFATADDKRMIGMIERSLSKSMQRMIVPTMPTTRRTAGGENGDADLRMATPERRKHTPAGPKRSRRRAASSSIFGLTRQGK